MKLFSSRKSISRERVVGISLADILLQAIFLLFIALLVGYKDPKEWVVLQESSAIGKDLCNKTDSDSMKACVQDFIKDKDLVEKLCNGEYKYDDKKKCLEAYLEAMKKTKEEKKGHLVPCIPALNSTKDTEISVYFKIIDKQTVRFDKFSEKYINYLTSHKDEARLKKVEEIKSHGQHSFNINNTELNEKFEFMREKECYHVPNTSPENGQQMFYGETLAPKNKVYNVIHNFAN